MSNTVQDIYVSQRDGAYVTNTVRGDRASCTSGAATAAQRLAEKLFGPALIKVAEVKEGNHFTTRWCAEADPEAWASVDDKGVVKIDPFIPPLNTGLARGPRRALIVTMQAVATRCATTGVLSIEPVAKATTRQAKDAAIEALLSSYSKRNGKKGSLSVYFSSTVVRFRP